MRKSKARYVTVTCLKLEIAQIEQHTSKNIFYIDATPQRLRTTAVINLDLCAFMDQIIGVSGLQKHVRAKKGHNFRGR